MSRAICWQTSCAKPFGLRPGELAALGDGKRRDHVQPLSAGRLAEADKPEVIQPVAHLPCGFDDRRERNVGAGIEIEHKTARHLRLLRLAIPGMQLESANLRDGNEAFHAVDLQIGLLVAEHRHQFQQVGGSRHGMALEELLAADPVRRADDRARPALDMLDQPRTDRFVIAGQILLGDRLAVVRRPARAACRGSRSARP